MSFDQDSRGSRGDDGGAAQRSAPGKRSLTDRIVQRRGAPDGGAVAAPAAGTPAGGEDPFALHLLGVVQRSGGGDASSAIATTAIERKDGGAPLDGQVRTVMEGQLGVDFGGVRVHSDAGAQRASAALGARAFAHQADIFMGPGESTSDLRLMAHEVTHVAQQGAAGAPAVQRQVTVGAADTPAERQADAVADRAVAAADAPAAGKGLLAADGAPVQPGQMTTRDFLALLHTQVLSTATAILGKSWQPDQCADIKNLFAHHAATDATTLERIVQRYTGVRAATSAADYVPAIVGRLSGAIARWGGGEELSWQMGSSGLPVAAEEGGGGGRGPQTQTSGPTPPPPAATESADDAQLQRVTPTSDLGAAVPLDGAVASRMGNAFGERFDHVLVHTDATAARTTSALGADALAVGSHVAFASGAYQPGTPAGDHLIAHELAHVLQQRGATGTSAPVSASTPHEDDADRAASAAVGQLHQGDDRAGIARPSLQSGLAVARGQRTPMENHLNGGLDGNLAGGAQLGAYLADGMTALNGGHSATTGVHYAKNYRRHVLDGDQDYVNLWQASWATGYADPNYFTKNGFCNWTLRANRSASEGIKAWLKGLTIAECLSAVVALQVDTLRARIGDAEFDRRFGMADGTAAAEQQMVISTNIWNSPAGSAGQAGEGRSTGIIPAILPAGQGAIGNRPVQKGDWVYFWNHPMYRYKHPGGDWRGENAICMGVDENGVQRWSGMGANNKTEQEMLQSMLTAYNSARNDYDNQKLAEIQAQNGDVMPAAYDPLQTPDLARGQGANPFTMNQMLAYPAVPSAAGAGDAKVAGIDFALIIRMDSGNVDNRLP